MLGRYTSGRRYLDEEDQMTIEMAGVYRHYHACIERNVRLGPVPDKLKNMYVIAIDAMHAAMEAMRPGNTNGDVYDAYAYTCVQAGLEPGTLPVAMLSAQPLPRAGSTGLFYIQAANSFCFPIWYFFYRPFCSMTKTD